MTAEDQVFDVTEKLACARVSLVGVCELLGCATAAPDELGEAGLEILATQVRQAENDVAAALAALEEVQASAEAGVPATPESRQKAD